MVKERAKGLFVGKQINQSNAGKFLLCAVVTFIILLETKYPVDLLISQHEI